MSPFLAGLAFAAVLAAQPTWQQLPPAFLTPGGKATIPAPDMAGIYWLHLRYDYSVDGVPQEPKIVSRMFTVVAPPTPVPTRRPPPTPTPCVVGIYGYPSGYRCYDCAGRVVPGAMPISATRCGPAPTVTPVSTRTPTATPTPVSAGGCVPDDLTLCLGSGRFAVQVHWAHRVTPAPGQWAGWGEGAGHAVPLSVDTGYFWFWRPGVELTVKVKTDVGWVFFAAMTDVEYDLTITDTTTAKERVYHNAQGHLYGFADTSPLPVESQGPGWTLAGAIAAVLAVGGGAYWRYRKTA